MQTFLPDADFAKCAKILDSKRGFKQCVEAKQIINTILNPAQKAWQNHPAVLMWRNNVDALRLYFNQFLDEYISRGYKIKKLTKEALPASIEMPWWFKDKQIFKKIINSHQSKLLAKKKEYYSKFNWNVPDNLDYFWAKEEK